METYVVIRDMSAGNDAVGEMWQETKIFSAETTLEEVMNWANEGGFRGKQQDYSRKRITITKPHTEDQQNK